MEIWRERDGGGGGGGGLRERERFGVREREGGELGVKSVAFCRKSFFTAKRSLPVIYLHSLGIGGKFAGSFLQ